MLTLLRIKRAPLYLPDIPPGDKPTKAVNLNVTQEAGGWVLRWDPPSEDDENPPLYYTVEFKPDSGKNDSFTQMTDLKIDVDEASYLSKILYLCS